MSDSPKTILRFDLAERIYLYAVDGTARVCCKPTGTLLSVGGVDTGPTRAVLIAVPPVCRHRRCRDGLVYRGHVPVGRVQMIRVTAGLFAVFFTVRLVILRGRLVTTLARISS